MNKLVVWRNGRMLGLLLVLLLGLQPTVIALSPMPQVPAQEPAPTDDVPDTATPTPDDESGGTVVTVPQRTTPTPTPLPDALEDTAVITHPASTSGAPAGWFTNRDCAQDLRVMFIGNSITRGKGTFPNGQSDTAPYNWGFRYYLDDSLSDSQYQYDFVGELTTGDQSGFVFDYDHNGFAGERADQLLLRLSANSDYPFNGIPDDNLLPPLLDLANPPDVILLHIGTNDLAQGQDVLLTINEITAILDTIDVRAPDTPVILAQIIKAADGTNDGNNPAYWETVNTFNSALATLVSNRPADQIWLVNMDILNYSYQSPDFEPPDAPAAQLDLHPNAQGYSKMAGVWFDALNSIWPTCVEIMSTAVTSATASQTYTYDVDAVADPQPVTYSLQTAPAGMTIHPTTGVISWTPAVAQVGLKQVEVRATNSSQTTSQQFTILVEAEHEIYLPMVVR